MSQSAKETVSSATSGTLYLILIQVASRALTFIGNQVLLRFLSPELLGIAVQLELFSVFVLYFSRESLRVALQRQPAQEAGRAKDGRQGERAVSLQSQTIINLSYLVIFLGSCLTLTFGYVWYHQADVVVLASPYFGTSLVLYGIATVIELLSEPSFVIIQQELLYKARAQAETRAAIFKCSAACLTAFLSTRLHWQPSALPFAIGQCGYAISLLSFYLTSVYPISKKQGFSLLLKSVGTSNAASYLSSYFSKPLLRLAGTLYAQSIFKQLLTQGDALILSFLASLSDQGAFAFASNYGGLVARLIFQPVEESSRNTFGKLLATPTTPTTTDPDPDPDPDKDDNLPSSSSSSNPTNPHPSPPALHAALTHLSTTLHLYSLIALLSLAYLPTLLPLLVLSLAGPRWCTPPISSLLATSSYAIPFLAYNGILDAFVTSVATPAELARQSVAMAGFTAAYLASAYLFLRVLGLGAQGLVVGNMLNMALRIAWSAVFIRRYLRRHGVASGAVGDVVKMASPSASTVASCVAAAAALRAYTPEKGFMLQDGLRSLVLVVAICGVGGLSMVYFERRILMPHLFAVLPERLASKLRTYTSSS